MSYSEYGLGAFVQRRSLRRIWRCSPEQEPVAATGWLPESRLPESRLGSCALSPLSPSSPARAELLTANRASWNYTCVVPHNEDEKPSGPISGPIMGRIMALDVGSRTIGLAVTDLLG